MRTIKELAAFIAELPQDWELEVLDLSPGSGIIFNAPDHLYPEHFYTETEPFTPEQQYKDSDAFFTMDHALLEEVERFPDDEKKLLRNRPAEAF